jgi:hypothetical protein
MWLEGERTALSYCVWFCQEEEEEEEEEEEGAVGL